jgi:hypothetical protein
MKMGHAYGELVLHQLMIYSTAQRLEMKIHNNVIIVLYPFICVTCILN